MNALLTGPISLYSFAFSPFFYQHVCVSLFVLTIFFSLFSITIATCYNRFNQIYAPTIFYVEGSAVRVRSTLELHVLYVRQSGGWCWKLLVRCFFLFYIVLVLGYFCLAAILISQLYSFSLITFSLFKTTSFQYFQLRATRT